ncbi:MAG: hypothetical protein AAF664_26310, partial [Planctomycetota bacterium]
RQVVVNRCRSISNCHALLRDDRGIAVSTELLAIATIAVLGILVALATVRDAVVNEYMDLQGGVQNNVQSYSVSGVTNLSATTSGMNFYDRTDDPFSQEDVTGQAYGEANFAVAPVDEALVISSNDLVVELLFDGNGNDTSPYGGSNNASLRGGASIVNGQLVLDGVNDSARIANSDDINTGGPFPQRTIHVEFTPADVMSRQLVYEEGGTIRGLNIYIDSGQLYFGGYNIPETGYQPTFLSTPIAAGQKFQATIVLDGGPSVTANAFSAFANGALVGRTAGSQLFAHGDGTGVGAVNGATVFHDGSSRASSNFGGTVDRVILYNRALNDVEVSGL